jgi:hypothetical protein
MARERVHEKKPPVKPAAVFLKARLTDSPLMNPANRE